MFSSVTHLFKFRSNNDSDNLSKPLKYKQPANILEYSILDAKGTFLPNFTLFHYETTLAIDVIIFLPHHGLYFGEKISWTAQEFKETSVKLFTKQSKKSPTTHLETTQTSLHQKLEDVLSFDSTPIEHFFWMEHLCESEFDELDSSFHRLLSKERLIFADDDIQNIQDKLFALSTYQEKPYSSLKVLGSLQAHRLLLPTKVDPFGAFLSVQQQVFLDTPTVPKTITILAGDFATGKSTLLIRKVLQSLLHNNDIKAAIITPTLLSGEILRKELLTLCEFGAITLDYSRIQFLNPPTPNETITPSTLSKDISLIAYDDCDTANTLFMDSLKQELQEQTVLISTSQLSHEQFNHNLDKTYRIPILKTINCVGSNEVLFTLLIELRELIQSYPSSSILILLSCDEEISSYKKAIDERFHIESSVINATFSLQYKNIDSIALSTPQYASGVCVADCFVVNIDPNSQEYKMSLSRSSKNVTFIAHTTSSTSSIL